MTNPLPASFYDKHFTDSAEYNAPAKESRYYPIWNIARAWLHRMGITTVIDLGCGPGQFADVLAGCKWLGSYQGTDFSHEAVRIANEKFRGDKRFVFYIMDLDRPVIIHTGYPDWAYTMLNFLEHIEHDVELLDGMERGAKMILSLPTYDAEGHVRHFNTPAEVTARYGKALDIQAAYEARTTNGALNYIIRAVRL
jgi:SAM-dependent methyltransferase